MYSCISLTASKLEFLEPTFYLPSMSLIIHSKNQSQLIEIFDLFSFFGKRLLISFNQPNSFSNCCFLMARLGKLSSLYKAVTIHYFMFSCTFGLKKPKTLVSQTSTKADLRIFLLRWSHFSCECDFTTFFVSSRYFPNFRKLVQIQEMMHWSMLAMISLSYCIELIAHVSYKNL